MGEYYLECRWVSSVCIPRTRRACVVRRSLTTTPVDGGCSALSVEETCEHVRYSTLATVFRVLGCREAA